MGNLIIHINNYHYPGTICVITIFGQIYFEISRFCFCHSPDLNPLDFTFWGQSMQKVWEVKPSTIPELKTVVEEYFAGLTPDFINKCVGNIRKRAELCIQANGSHFEHLL